MKPISYPSINILLQSLLVEAGIQWLPNWYFVQDYGITLFGPAPNTFIEPISKEEFLEAIEKQALEWREYVKNTIHSRPYQGYAILTMCRALYTLKHGELVSKIKAARWFKKEIPEYAWLIDNALKWREDYRNENINHEETYLEIVEFVHFVIDRISNRQYDDYNLTELHPHVEEQKRGSQGASRKLHFLQYACKPESMNQTEQENDNPAVLCFPS